MTPQSIQTNLSVNVTGMTFTDPQITAALTQCGLKFDNSTFAASLRKSCGKPLPTRASGRVLQALQRKGVVVFDRSAQLWRKVPQRAAASPATLPLLPVAGTALPGAITRRSISRFDRFATTSRLSLSALSCICLICALIILNASFAWELGREAGHFRAAFVMGLMALDLMRPFLVAAGFALATQGRGVLASAAFTVAFALSPVSILSSTAILSSALLLGVQMNDDTATRVSTLTTLRGEHARVLAEVDRLQSAWIVECDRGGCGPIAGDLELEFSGLAREAKGILDRIVALTESTTGASELLARMVTTFQQMGIFTGDRQIWLPLFLALSLELGALFGPALLLRR